MNTIRRQVGVTMPEIIKNKLYKVASIEKRSVSSVCAEAIIIYLDKWMMKAKNQPKEESK
jgi:hypothetical protein